MGASGDESAHGYVVPARGGVKLEMAFPARGAGGEVYTPLPDGRAPWPDGAFGDDVADLRGVRARVVSRAALVADKSEAHDDPVVAAKDRADLETVRLSRCRGG